MYWLKEILKYYAKKLVSFSSEKVTGFCMLLATEHTFSESSELDLYDAIRVFPATLLCIIHRKV